MQNCSNPLSDVVATRMPAPLIRSIDIRAVVVPLRRPVIAGIGKFTDWPLVLVDVRLVGGVVGSAYVARYRTRSVPAIVAELRDLAQGLIGSPAAPFDAFDSAARQLNVIGLSGVSVISTAAIDMALWDALAKEASNPDVLHARKTITYAAARIAIDAAVEKSRALECIAVVDASSNLLAFARVDGAAVIARDPSIAEGSIAAALGGATGQITFEFGANLWLASQGAVVNLGGGLPIVVDGAVVDAIGVGSSTTEQDLAVAEAGRQALISALGA